MRPIKTEIWKRFDLYYHAHLPAYRLWKRGLSWLALVACVVWLGTAEWDRNRTPYSSGGMSPGHAFLAQKCDVCHTGPLEGFMPESEKGKSMNAACLNCHQNSIGHDSVTMSAWHQWPGPGPSREPGASLACSSCHTEHKGPTRLVAIVDSKCVRCHADLSAVYAEPDFADKVTSFATDHPEFEFRLALDASPVGVVAGPAVRADPGHLKFPHDKHMRSGLPLRYVRPADKSNGTPPVPDDRPRVQMDCYDCHRHGESTRHWPYARPELHEMLGLATTESEPSLQAAYMVPIRYSLHCAECHLLGTDPRFHGEDTQIPHRTPAEIRTFLWGELSRFFKANPRVLIEPKSWQAPSFIKSDEPKELTPAQQEKLLERVEEEVGRIEDRLYWHQRICQDCHEMHLPKRESGELPTIIGPNVPERWFGSASFTHEKHRVLDCTECHTKAPASGKAEDVLMPGIALCRRCHGPSSGAAAGVSDRCVSCHTYHRPVGEGFPQVGKSLSELTADRPR